MTPATYCPDDCSKPPQLNPYSPKECESQASKQEEETIYEKGETSLQKEEERGVVRNELLQEIADQLRAISLSFHHSRNHHA